MTRRELINDSFALVWSNAVKTEPPPELTRNLPDGSKNYVWLAQALIAENYPVIVYAKPRLMDLPAGAILGTWQYSIPGKVRFIFDRENEIAPGVLPGDLARAWIRDTYTLPLRRRKDELKGGFGVPLYSQRGKHGDCSYVDISGAYRRILSLGYDVEYKRNQYIGANPVPVPAQIAKHKFCYSIAVSMSSSIRSNLEIMGNDGVYSRQPLNVFSNPCLYILANDTLNAIGGEILAVLGEKNVFYANTDGFLVKTELAKYAIDIIESWGFKALIKLEGNTEVFGVGSYRCGDYRTRRLDRNAEDYSGRFMSRDSRGWLKRQWVNWSGHLN
jgi:hypothetical protein